MGNMNSSSLTTGNAHTEGLPEGRGWFIGRFVPLARGLGHTHDIEVKWGEHRAGEARTILGISQTAKTLTLLIRGVFVVEFPELGETVTLAKEGDYVIYAPKVAHTWKAIDDCLVVTVRWPSE